MVPNKFTTFITLLTVIILLLTACQSIGSTPDLAKTAAVETITAMPSNTTQPTATATIIPTATATLTPTATATITPTATPVAYGPSNFPDNIDPLTGLPVSDPSILNRRPVMVKISNFPSSGRPQAGMSSADIIFDYGIDAGTNRFMAIYYGQDSDKVGPIRSGRYVDADLVSMYQGILAYGSAWAPELAKILSVLGNRAFMEGTNTCPAICRDPSVTKDPTVINLFADTAALTTYAAAHGVTQQRYNLDGMAFNEAVPAGGTPGTFLSVEFGVHNQADWKYDPITGKYLRWIEERDDTGQVITDANGNLVMIPLIDRNNDQQLAFSNVIMIYANYIKDFEAVYEIPIGTSTILQKAIIFRNGQIYDAYWKSAGYDKPMQFFTTDNQPFPLQPGNTYIVIGGLNSQFSQPDAQTDPARWLFYYNPP
jgi:hypothetical protein